jgi:hypothetical protein
MASPPPFELLVGDQNVPYYRMGKPPAIVLTPIDHYGSLRLQVGHEVFHWLCTPETAAPGVFHWTHEMLAVITSLACVRLEHALADYANENEELFRQQAKSFSIAEMVTTRLSTDPVHDPYPEGLFGRALETGAQLRSKVGWKRLRLLASCFDTAGRTPDVRAWLEGLAPPKRDAAIRVLGTPTDAWV